VAVPASRRRALVIAGPGYSPAAALTSPALAVDQRPPSQAPADADGWRPYTAVCLADATGTALTAAQRAALARYVQDGGGLVILGSGPCAGPADSDDPLNKAAPLVANPYQRRPLKVIVVLDASGSMGQEVIDEAGKAGGVRKFDVAVEAVQSLKQHLTPRDALTVIRFAETAALAYDSGAGPIDFGRLHAIDRRTAPAGSTKIKGALEMALGAVPGQGRDGLVLIVSDLETQDSDLPAADLAGQFRRAKLTVAAVVTSPDEQKQNASLLRFLEDLRADRIASERLTGLAELFGRYVRKARGEPVRRGAFTARGEGRVFGVADFSLPLTAYLPSAMKSDAAVLVQVGNDPVVAHRQRGLGKVVSIAVPVDGKDNAALGDSPALADLLARAVAWSARPEGDPRFSGQIVDRRRGRRLTVTAADGAGPMDSLALTCAAARATGQEETPRSFPLRQTAPGRYEADLPPSAGPETLQVAAGDGRVVWWTSPPHRAASEFAAVGADWEALRRLADLTGGRLLPAGRLGDLPAHVKQASARHRIALWPWLLALAAAAMLADWCTARVLQRGK
jgi:hypothetical protein